MSSYNMKGKRRYRCMDCNSAQFESSSSMSNRCKTRCKSCGGTFLEPDTEGAVDQFVTAASVRAVMQPINEGKKSITNREHHELQQ